MSSTLVEGRSCEGCAMCCKIPEIKALNKPAHVWCEFCPTHQSCNNYEHRPDTCRNFNCGWLLHDFIGEAWRPAKSRMMIVMAEGKHLFVQVDPTRADAWRNKPFIDDLKRWARQGNPQGAQVVVAIGQRYVVVFPDREEDLGTVGIDETVIFETMPDGRTQPRKVKNA